MAVSEGAGDDRVDQPGLNRLVEQVIHIIHVCRREATSTKNSVSPFSVTIFISWSAFRPIESLYFFLPAPSTRPESKSKFPYFAISAATFILHAFIMFGIFYVSIQVSVSVGNMTSLETNSGGAAQACSGLSQPARHAHAAAASSRFEKTAVVREAIVTCA